MRRFQAKPRSDLIAVAQHPCTVHNVKRELSGAEELRHAGKQLQIHAGNSA